MINRLILSLTVVLLLSIQSFAQSSSTLENAPCPVEVPAGFTEGTGAGQIECGFINVPEFHADPDGNQIRLAVAIIHSNATPEPDPLFVAQGGPGGSTLEAFIPLAPLFTFVLQQRDVVLVEQRGTLHSLPALTCPESFDFTLDTLDDNLEIDLLLSLQGEAYQTCFDRLRSEGVNLSAYNSVENAADTIAVADTLGYDEINFYGVSYGTMLGQHLLRDYENRIRSIIFDSVVPLELNFIPDMLRSGNEALNLILEACTSDEQCNTAYRKSVV